MSKCATFCVVLVWLQCINLVLPSSLYTRDRAPADTCCVDCREEEAHFSYEPSTCHAPRFWYLITPEWRFCRGRHQSPVNIRTATSEFTSLMRPVFRNLNARLPAKTRNNGHSPKFETDYNDIGLSGVPFASPHDVYIFKELHPHLGRIPDYGSEHSVDGNYKPIELHMVFWNSKYGDIEHAESRPGGLVVIGVHVEVGDRVDGFYVEEQEKYNPRPPQHIHNRCTCTNDFFYGHMCQQLGHCRCSSDKDCPLGGKCRFSGRSSYCGRPLTCRVRFAHMFSQLAEKYFPMIQYPERHASHRGEMSYLHVPEGITPEDTLPYDGEFYTYQGSLTTPPCYETVQWIMMRCPIRVSRQAYHALAMIRDVHHHPLSRDGVQRPIQRGTPFLPPVQVYRNFLWETAGRGMPFSDVTDIRKNGVY